MDDRTGSLIRAGVDAVTRACRITRRVQSELAAIQQITKDDHSPVTVADFAAQAMVVHHLEQALGPQLLVAEESAEILRAAPQRAVLDAVVQALRPEWP